MHLQYTIFEDMSFSMYLKLFAQKKELNFITIKLSFMTCDNIILRCKQLRSR